MKKYDSRNQKTFPDFATKGAAGAAALAVRSGDGGKAEGAERPRAMLDIPTPLLGHDSVGFVRRMLNRSSRRFYSRALLGLSLPGRYYFLTYTTTPDTPHPVGHYWASLWKWHRRYRPGAPCCYGITSEGKGRGVIHMIIRLLPGQKRMDVKVLRAHWFEMTGAKQIKIVHVPETMKDNLAAYIADQRKKKGLAGEMAWQDYLERWRWTSGWLPTGFTKAFGRVWHRAAQSEIEWLPDAVVRSWLQLCHRDPAQVNHPPIITKEVKT